MDHGHFKRWLEGGQHKNPTFAEPESQTHVKLVPIQSICERFSFRKGGVGEMLAFDHAAGVPKWTINGPQGPKNGPWSIFYEPWSIFYEPWFIFVYIVHLNVSFKG
jgi:hypothetical protein